ncbi:MAG: right-handed parallel beta-helix repeat-containing protein [Candidatus Brocadiae bacterium]|nr:right-handed parallel beta-helix repeat-containing protein [Candidatus Brocadiia bacterium]
MSGCRQAVGRARRCTGALVLLIAALVAAGSAPARWLVAGDDSPGGGRVFTVSPDGDDAADGSARTPWRTVGRAVQAAGPGVTVNLLPGVYREGVVLEGRGGAEGRPFTLQSAEGGRAVLDGGLSVDTGMDVHVPYVVIRGLEIRNCRHRGVRLNGRRAECHHVLVEKNVIHHIGDPTGEAPEAAYGVRVLGVSDCTIRRNTIYFVFGNNESFGVHFDLRSAYENAIHNAVIEKNLFYLIDKAGVRITDNWLKYYVLADPAYIRGNISVHIGYVGLEVNYVNTHVTHGGPLGDKDGAPVYVEDNFVGWCSSHGINPKQSADGVTRRNTIYNCRRSGYLQSGHDSYRMRIEGNLLVDNVLGSIVHTVGVDNQFIGNYYRQLPAWPEFFVDRTEGWGTTYTRMTDLHSRSVLKGVEAQGVLDNEAALFRAPQKGDFRLIPGCPAAGTAPDGGDFGARESVLSGVGASGKWGLANIPLLPEVKGMRVVGVSSEDPGRCPVNPDAHYFGRSKAVDAAKVAAGVAAHLVDGVPSSAWRPLDGQMPAWVAIELPGERPIPVGAFAINVCHNRYQDECNCNVRDFKLYGRVSEEEEWRELGAYTRYARAAGRIFPIDGAPRVRQLKLEVLSNNGWPGAVEVGEFRLYRAFEPIE